MDAQGRKLAHDVPADLDGRVEYVYKSFSHEDADGSTVCTIKRRALDPYLYREPASFMVPWHPEELVWWWDHCRFDAPRHYLKDFYEKGDYEGDDDGRVQA